MEQVEALLLSLVRPDAGVCFIDDNKIRTGPGEPIPTFLGFDVVKADHRERIGIEKGLRQWEVALQTCRSPGGDGNGIDPEAILQFCDPLVHEVRRAENRKRIDFSAIHQFAEDQTGFDGLADADVVGNQQPRDLKPKGHEKRDQLVRPRFKSKLCGGSERACPPAEGQPQRVGKKRRLGLHCRARIVRQVETSGFYRCKLEIRSKNHDVVFIAREGAQGEQALAGCRQGNPFTAARSDKISRSKIHSHINLQNSS